MGKKEKRQGSAPESTLKYMAEILKAAVLSVILSASLLLLEAALISAGILSENYFGVCVAVACMLGSLFGGLYAIKRIRKATLLVGLGNSVAAFMFLLVLGLLWSGGNLDVNNGAVSMGSCLCGGGIAGIFGGVKAKKRR